MTKDVEDWYKTIRDQFFDKKGERKNQTNKKQNTKNIYDTRKP